MVGMGIFMVLIALWLGGMGLADQKALWWRFQAQRFRVIQRRTSLRRSGIGGGGF